MSDSLISLPELAGSAAFCFLVLDRAFTFASKFKNGKSNGTNGASGEKSVDFWKNEFRAGVREELHNQGLAATLIEIRDAVRELVLYEQLRQRK
jgi:hypothetical protein